MANIPHLTGTVNASIGASVNAYGWFAANCPSYPVGLSGDNSGTRVTWRTPGTASLLTIRILTNDRGASTLKFRKTGVDGAQSVAITASTTGTFQDLVNTDAISSGDLLNWHLLTGAGGTTFTYDTLGFVFAATTGSAQRLLSQMGNPLVDGLYLTLCGTRPNGSTEVDQGTYFPMAGTLSHWAFQVPSNFATSGTGSARSFRNGAYGSVSISIAFGATGVFEDTTTVETVTAGDLWGWKFDSTLNSSPGHNWRAVDFSSPTGLGLLAATGGGIFVLGGNTKYGFVAGQAVEVTTEADVKSTVLLGQTLNFMTCRVAFNSTTATGTFVLRKNAADTALTVSIPSGTTGRFTDAADSVTVVSSDLLNIKVVTGGVSGTLIVSSYTTAFGNVSAVVDVPQTTIAGVLAPIKRGTLDISETQNARNTLTCDVVSTGSYRPAVEAEVVVMLNNTRIFAGTLDKTTERGAGDVGLSNLFIRCNVNDFNSLADRKYIQTTFAAGTLKSMLTTLVTYLSTFGVTLHPAQVTGPSLDALSYDYTQATEILNDFTLVSSGYLWEIDYDKQLRMYLPGTLTAPFNIVTGNGYPLGDIQIEHNARTSYANRIILRAGTNMLVEKSDDFTGNGVLTSFTLTYTPVVRADPYTAFYGYVTNNAVNETLGVGATWTFNAGTNQITRTTAPNNGNPINVKYLVQFPITVLADDTGSQPPILELLIEAPDVFDIAVAQAIADAELAKALEQLTTVRYVTRGIGLKPGQTQTITVSTRRPRHGDGPHPTAAPSGPDAGSGGDMNP